jgi:hypothetical protein
MKPCVDDPVGSRTSKRILTAVRLRSCVRPCRRGAMTAGPEGVRDPVPDNQAASEQRARHVRRNRPPGCNGNRWCDRCRLTGTAAEILPVSTDVWDGPKVGAAFQGRAREFHSQLITASLLSLKQMHEIRSDAVRKSEARSARPRPMRPEVLTEIEKACRTVPLAGCLRRSIGRDRKTLSVGNVWLISVPNCVPTRVKAALTNRVIVAAQ